MGQRSVRKKNRSQAARRRMTLEALPTCYKMLLDVTDFEISPLLPLADLSPRQALRRTLAASGNVSASLINKSGPVTPLQRTLFVMIVVMHICQWA